jgi:hypothetical protein
MRKPYKNTQIVVTVMSIYDEMAKKADELEKLMLRRDKLYEAMSKLSIGDTVYENGSYGDIFPQIVKEIDLDNLRILTYEESIKTTKWVNYVMTYNEETEDYETVY